MSTPLQGTESAAGAIARVKYSHDAMIDLIIASPMISQAAIAKHFGYTQPWVSRIFNSDAFQARLAERKTELVDPTIALTIDEKLKAVADKSLDVVLEKLNLSPTFDMAVKAAELTSKALGYGARDRGGVVQNNFVVALPGKAESAQSWMERHAPGGGQIIDVTP